MSALAGNKPGVLTKDAFVEKLWRSDGIILRVPINSKGWENSAKAEIRLHYIGGETATGANLQQVWSESKSLVIWS
jgi:hypothetical protein